MINRLATELAVSKPLTPVLISSGLKNDPMPPLIARNTTLLETTSAAASLAASTIEPSEVSVTKPVVEVIKPTRRSPNRSVKVTLPFVATSTLPKPVRSVVP